MYRYLNIISYIVFISTFISCTTAVYVPLEILRPATTTLPDSIHTLAIINNAPERSLQEDEGEIIDIYNEQQKLQIERENLIPYFIQSLSSTLKSASGNNLSILSLSNDSVTGNILPNDKILSIKDSLKADAILSLDKLSVVPTIKLTQIDEALIVGDLNIIVHSDLKLYNGYTIPNSYSFSDTLSWQSYGETQNRTLNKFPYFQGCLIDAANYSGEQICKNFYPYIDNADRFYFVTQYPLMKEANLYWKKGKYDEAFYLWEYIYDNTKDAGRKAKAAANMALYEELHDRYESSSNWVKKSLNIFSKKPDKYSDYIEYLLEYLSQLNIRIKENKQYSF